MLFGLMPLLLIFFAVTMGVNDGKDKNNQPANQQNNEKRVILADVADKLRQIRIHSKAIIPHLSQM